MVVLAWSDLQPADLGSIAHLATRCLEVDGGLPYLDSPDLIGRLFGSGPGRVGRDETGEVVAAIAMFRDGQGLRTVTGLVHPALRGQGVAEDLASWARERAEGDPVRVVLENDTRAADEILASIAMVKIRSEAVMCHHLVSIPIIRRLEGLRSVPYDSTSAPLFHTAWQRSFGDQPGFQRVPEEQWYADLVSLPQFRPADSRVLVTEVGEPIAFVILSDDWLDQVGVVPDWRGHQLGAHLVVRSLTALKKAGSNQAWLCVNTDNPALALYERLGFVVVGHRGRYADPTSVAAAASTS